MKKIILLAAGFFGVLELIYAQQGELDSSFGTNGIVKTRFGDNTFIYNSSVVQKDGKIVAVGWAYINDTTYFAIVRYNTDGSLDSSFSKDGKQTVDFGIVNQQAYAVAIQNDGKIVVAGNSGSYETDIAIARINTDGSFDKTFSEDGKQITDFSDNDYAYSIAIQSDGKIVVGGTIGYEETADFLVIRYNTDGSLDSSFSGDGIQSTDFGAGNEARSIAIQSDGKIVAAGFSGNKESDNDAYDFALARFNIDGTLDSSFGENGIKTADFGVDEAGLAAAIQSDGKIVIGGFAGVLGDTLIGNFALARLSTDGSIDNTFGSSGIQTTDFGVSTEIISSLAIQNNGKIIAGGVAASDTTADFALARYNADGSLDNSFSEDGKQITDVDHGFEKIASIAISNNELYAVGLGQFRDSVLGVVARYLLDDESENKSPTVSLSIPYNIVKYTAPGRIKLNAAATDKDGTITKVQFFNGDTKIHTEDVYPYGFLWIDVPVGTYTLTAKAFDNSGNVTTSNSIKVSVVKENVPPVVSIASPVDDTTYTGPATIRLIAKAHDPGDKISKVEFYNGATLIRIEHYYPYAYTWTNVQPGTYTITAKAYDDKGLSATSDPVIVTVTSTMVPIVRGRSSSVNSKTGANGTLSLGLSPNPARSTLQISIKGLQLNKRSTISVISAAGVVWKTIQSNSLNKVVQLDVSSLASGAYTIKLINGNKVLCEKFLKL